MTSRTFASGVLTLAIYFGVFISAPSGSFSQKTVTQIWYTYDQQAKVHHKWGYLFDLNHRTGTFKEFKAVVSAARAGAFFHINKNERLAAGYAWFGTYLHDAPVEMLHEHRLWQQYQQFGHSKKTSWFHRFRVEERWREQIPIGRIEPGDTYFTLRARYMFRIQGTMIKDATMGWPLVHWQAATELMLHSGQGINDHNFDQFRLVGGPVVQLSKPMQLALLYQYINQYKPISQRHQNIHSLRLTLFHNIDFSTTQRAQRSGNS
ncbi:MAG TPA: DUF2490 domain-containing protein [Phnomibacter sp.]|nr:DUF2490 domain-containing protein [Phnomibacter sp.]